jgi:hypothetical protein
MSYLPAGLRDRLLEADNRHCLGWTVGQSYTAYGLRFGLRSNDPSALAQVASRVPLGWQPSSLDEVDIWYSFHVAPRSELEAQHRDHLLYCDSTLLARSVDSASLFTAFENHAQLLTAFSAKDYLFVHAGAVGWQGRAMLIPGRSMAGKTTLVGALVQAGATYYSDEYAVLDKDGRVHPYALPLSIRENMGQIGRKTPVESIGGQAGVEPLPVGLVVVTQYQPRARWRPQVLSPAQALLALMDNTVAAQREPHYTMPILRQVVMNAHTIQSKRGSAKPIAHALLRMLP